MHPNIYLCLCVCVCYTRTYTYTIHLSVCVRTGRRCVCVHQCAMVMDRLCAHGLAGSCCGLGLKPETLHRASPSRRRGPRAASARRRSTRSTRRRGSMPTSARGTPRPSTCCTRYAPLAARRRALRRTRSAGLRCGAAGCGRRHRRCARACAHVQALALRGAMGVGTAARRGGSVHASEYIYVCASVCSTLSPTLSIYLCV